MVQYSTVKPYCTCRVYMSTCTRGGGQVTPDDTPQASTASFVITDARRLCSATLGGHTRQGLISETSTWPQNSHKKSMKQVAFLLLVGLARTAAWAPTFHFRRTTSVRAVSRVSIATLVDAGLPAVGDSLQVEIDVAEEGAEKLVWTAATVSSVDADTGEFRVMVTGFADLPEDDEEYEEAYEEGPCIVRQENAYVDGYEGRWRREPASAASPSVRSAAPASKQASTVRVTTRRGGVAIKTTVKEAAPSGATSRPKAPSEPAPRPPEKTPTLPAVGEAIEVEIDVAEEGAEKLVWTAATVSSVDADTGEFRVMVTGFADLPEDDEEYEEAYEEGPYIVRQENAYVDGYEGRWRRLPRVAESVGWRPWLEDRSDGANGWWRQDETTVILAVELPEGATFKRNVAFELKDDSLELKVTSPDEASVTAVRLSGRTAHKIDADESDWFVEDAAGLKGFDHFGADARFLVVTLRKATRGVEWTSVLLKEGEEQAVKVSVKRSDGATVRRPDGPASTPKDASTAPQPPPAPPPPRSRTKR